MKNKKTVSLVMAALMTIAAMFTFSACTTPAQAKLTGIEITKAPTKVEYVLGEKFDPAGMEVSKVFDDKTKTALTADEYTWDLKGELKLTDKKVTISYKAEEQTYTAPVTIKVTNDMQTITVLTEPAKKEYLTGEVFDPTGMTIQGTFQNGTKGEVVEVSADTVDYKTGKLVASDSHFEMKYAGKTFYYDMTVKCGAFMEAEAGLTITSGVKVSGAPNQVAIEADLNNSYCKSGDGIPSVRGIDIGLSKVGDDGKTYKIEEQRVDVRNYIFDPADTEYSYKDFCATGGGNYSSLVAHSNILEFDRSGNGSILYALTADKAGKVNFILRMSVSDPDNSSVAPETKLSDVIEITVNGKKVDMADTIKLETVDFSAKKAYVPSTTDLSTLGDYKGTFAGKSISTQYYWQNVSVPIDMVEGGNSIIVKSIMTEAKNGKRNMFIDSVSFDGDASKVSLFNESAFEPEIMSAKLKVEDNKVYMGLIVDPKSVGYDESAIKTVLALTQVKGTSCSSWGTADGEGNINSNGSGDKNDPWTSPTSYGGLGYTSAPLMLTHSMVGNWKDQINGRGAPTVEKIADGDYKDCYCVWFEVTIPVDTKLGTTPDKNRYTGAFYFSGFTYGKDYANVHPAKDILKTDDSTCVENGDYCYQVYCDARDKYACFYAGNEINIMLIVQHGTFDATKATDSLPLCNKLMRRYMSHLADNDQELIDLRKDQETEPKA